MKRVFISGKITGDDNYVERFDKAYKHLRDLGYCPVNPCEEEGHDYRWYIDNALRKLFTCDMVYHLNNWKDSPGARLEHHYAELVGMEILYE